ncbi:N5,N10-methylene tetrahydromethanopterin reductase [Streptomonospora alba]|uniref:N5,N10-methylene tetrahydromethanopterin reductase n=1 Tax=Streptomonospora alba TaxID=183763 RepID=A0A0C2G5L0_9ACTN|nr:LLM class flavin-dependent oxidoreductase [Streptomonospora alba]KIH98558.1 N5,N10-methylene tetrahydromethanopterin reductase [Streptomonospora alba]
MRISTALPTAHTGVPDTAMAQHLEDLGFDGVSMPDLLFGDGTPGADPVVALAAAAQRTSRISLEFGVLSLPLRPVAPVAAQIQTLQHLSGERVVLGAGLGGFPGSPFWRAAGAPLGGRGRRADAALAALPGLVRGEPTAVDGETGTLAPAATAPPIYVGGNSEAAMRRAVLYGDGWAPSLITPADLAAKAERLRTIAAELDRPVPAISVGGHGVLNGSTETVQAFVDNVSRMHGVSEDEASRIPVTGGPDRVAERLADYADAGAHAVTLPLDGDSWPEQAASLAEAASRLRPGR